MSDQDKSESQKSDPIYGLLDEENLAKGITVETSGDDGMCNVSEVTQMVLEMCTEKNDRPVAGIDEAKENVTYEKAIAQFQRHES